MNIRKLVGSFTLAALLVTAAFAQDPGPRGGQGGQPGRGQGQGQGRGQFGGGMQMMGGGGNPLNLVLRKDVGQELKLSEDQVTKLQALRGAQGGPGGGGEFGARGGGQRGPGGPGGGGQGGPGGGGQGGPGGPGGGGGFGGPGGQGGPGAPGAQQGRPGGMGQGGPNGGQQMEKITAILTTSQAKRFKEIFIQTAKERALNDAQVQKDLGLSNAQVTKLKDIQATAPQRMRPLLESARNGEITQEELMPKLQALQAEVGAEMLKVLTSEQAKLFKAMAGVEFKFDPNEPLGGGRRRNG